MTLVDVKFLLTVLKSRLAWRWIDKQAETDRRYIIVLFVVCDGVAVVERGWTA
jgi:hypothetical protein